MSDQYEENITRLLNAKGGRVGILVYEHWDMVAPLFYYASGCYGCLTQIKRDRDPRVSERLGDLFTKLMADDRIASNEYKIVSKEMSKWTYPLDEDQKAQLREVLEPYAEYQKIIHGTKDHITIRREVTGPRLDYDELEFDATNKSKFSKPE